MIYLTHDLFNDDEITPRNESKLFELLSIWSDPRFTRVCAQNQLRWRTGRSSQMVTSSSLHNAKHVYLLVCSVLTTRHRAILDEFRKSWKKIRKTIRRGISVQNKGGYFGELIVDVDRAQAAMEEIPKRKRGMSDRCRTQNNNNILCHWWARCTCKTVTSRVKTWLRNAAPSGFSNHRQPIETGGLKRSTKNRCNGLFFFVRLGRLRRNLATLRRSDKGNAKFRFCVWHLIVFESRTLLGGRVSVVFRAAQPSDASLSPLDASTAPFVAEKRPAIVQRKSLSWSIASDGLFASQSR